MKDIYKSRIGAELRKERKKEALYSLIIGLVFIGFLTLTLVKMFELTAIVISL